MADDDQAAINADVDADCFFSPVTRFPQTSLLGFAALSVVIGLSSEQAVLKLKQVAETIFSKPERGADSTLQTDITNPSPPIPSQYKNLGINPDRLSLTNY
jgi:hypothetical protein